RAAGRDRPVRAPLSALLALRHATDLARRGRLVHPCRRDAPAAPGRQRDGRMDAAAIRQADGRLVPEHERLEHLAPPLLRPAASLLPVLLRPTERDRLAGRA